MRRSSPAGRFGIGISVVLLVVALQAVIEVLGGAERTRLLFRVASTALELPLIMLALTVTSSWTKKKQLGSAASVICGVVVAGVLGTGLGLALYEFTVAFPGFRRPNAILSGPARAAAFGFLSGQFHFGIWTLAFVYPFAIEDQRMRAVEAERLVAAADLARLRSHLEPHFILNTLNAIAGLVTEEPRQARRLIAALGDLLREATQDGGEMRTVEDEIAWLRRYAEILEARYGDHLAFAWEVDPKASGVLLPRLLLQPLVENAVKHGALKREDGGSVTIRVGLDEADLLRCTIEDDGPGIGDAPTRSGAVGLEAVRRRLALKDRRAQLAIESSPKGTRATVSWPVEVRS